MSIWNLRSWIVILVLMALASGVLSQDQPSASQQSGASSTTQSQDSSDQTSKNKKEKQKKKDKQEKDNRSADTSDTSVFSDSVANDVMNDIRDGLEGHSQRLMLSAFDGDKMGGFLTFEDQIQAYFEKFESFRVHMRVIQTTVEQSRGVVLTEFQVEAMPRSGGAVSRTTSQIRFELEKGKKGWKVVDLRPRAFFS